MARELHTDSGKWEFDHHVGDHGTQYVTWSFAPVGGGVTLHGISHSGEARQRAAALVLEADVVEGRIDNREYAERVETAESSDEVDT